MKRCLLRPIKMRKCLNLMITENLRSSLKVRHQAHESMSSRIIPIRSCARSRASYFRQSRSYATRSPLKPRRGVLDIGLLGLTGIAITATAAYWWSKRQPKPSTFTVATRNTPAITISKLTNSQVDSHLRANEATYTVARLGNPVYRYDTNNVKSNDPIEDYSSAFISSREKLANDTTGDMMLFGLYDGHSGLGTSKRLSEELIDMVINELQSVITKKPEYVAAVRKFASLSSSDVAKTFSTSVSQTPPPPPYFPSKLGPEVSNNLARLWDILYHGLYAKHLPYMLSSSHLDDSAYNLEKYPPVIHQALKNAFKKLDNDIIYTPVRLIAEREIALKQNSASNDKPDYFANIDKNKTILPAFSGSCALLAYLDVPHNMLHVACTGDSRAVMGIWEPPKDGSKEGNWRSRVLSEDQQGDNPSEVARIRAEHPPSERDQVISRNRVLGCLAPSRAFGDGSYKWTLDIRSQIAEAFDITPRRKSIPSKTPPYVTAEPEVTTCDLTSKSNELQENAEETKIKNADRRFIVLATDGLWDRLESEEVVGLVGAWLDGVRESRSRENILSRVFASPPGEDASSDSTKPPSSRKIPKEFAFVDSNISTHLIRNALGGNDRDTLSVLLAIPAPISRRYRDDITVTVVLLGDDDGNAKQPSGVRRLFLPNTRS